MFLLGKVCPTYSIDAPLRPSQLGKILSSVFGKDSALSANAQRIVVTSFAHLMPETLLTKFALRTRVRSFQVASSGWQVGNGIFYIFITNNIFML